MTPFEYIVFALVVAGFLAICTFTALSGHPQGRKWRRTWRPPHAPVAAVGAVALIGVASLFDGDPVIGVICTGNAAGAIYLVWRLRRQSGVHYPSGAIDIADAWGWWVDGLGWVPDGPGPYHLPDGGLVYARRRRFVDGRLDP